MKLNKCIKLTNIVVTHYIAVHPTSFNSLKEWQKMKSYDPSLKKIFGDHCSAFDCNHKRSDQKCSFLSCPSYAEWKKKWIVAIGRLHVGEDGYVNPDKTVATKETSHTLLSLL